MNYIHAPANLQEIRMMIEADERWWIQTVNRQCQIMVEWNEHIQAVEESQLSSRISVNNYRGHSFISLT
jgi:hypothetical protein